MNSYQHLFLKKSIFRTHLYLFPNVIHINNPNIRKYLSWYVFVSFLQGYIKKNLNTYQKTYTFLLFLYMLLSYDETIQKKTYIFAK